MTNSKYFSLLCLFLLGQLLYGCGAIEEKRKIDYKSSGAGSRIEPLQIPPELGAIDASDQYVIPGSDSTTFSKYAASRGGDVALTKTQLLPDVPGVEIGREGTYRWLVVQKPAEDIWPVISEFWLNQGFLIQQQSPETGIIETDWAEDVSQVDLGAVRSFIKKWLPGAYTNPERDRFITRIERVSDTETQIFVAHEGMAEISRREGREWDVFWQARPRDPNIEAKMLYRMMIFLGIPENEAADRGLSVESQAMATLLPIDAEEGVFGLALSYPFETSWNRINVVLLNIGASVESQDKDSGIFYVRYRDPAGKKEKKGLEKLKFWEDEEQVETLTYQIVVTGDEQGSIVRVLDETGAELTSDTAKRILSVLQERLG